MIFLTDAQVAGVLSPSLAAEAVERAFGALASGEAAVQARVRTSTSSGKLSTVGAVLTAQGLAGAKVYPTTNDGRFGFVMLLFELAEGRLLAVMEGTELTRIRTAATCVVAARRLARPESEVLTLFGAGHQALAQARGFAAIAPLREIRLVHRREAPDFVARLATVTGVPVRQMTDAELAIRDADLVVTATRATAPLFPGSALPPGVHVTAVGATLATSSEIDPETVRRAALVAVELTSQARQEAGDLLAAEAAGAFAWERAVELADLVVGRVAGRTEPDQITLFDSVGIGLEDVAAAAAAFAEARARGIGSELASGAGTWVG